jgi:hypothetical protein
MPTVYFHPGAPKTGTSYLQVLFARHIEEMAEHGLVYPENDFVKGAREGQITSGNGVELANFIRPELPHSIDNKFAFIDNLDHLLKSGDGKDFLFSSEFMVFQENERTDALINCLQKNKYDAKVIYLVRDFSKAARSSYSQQVKRAGEDRTFEEFIKKWDPYYLHHINLMNAAFGKEKVNIFNYEEHKSRLASLFFKDFIGIDIEFKNTGQNKIINRSLDGKELELLRIFNEFSGGGNSSSSTLISDALMKIPSISNEKFVATPEEFEILSSRFGGAIAEINSQLCGQKISLAGDVKPADRQVHLSEFERFTVAALAQITKSIRR